VVQHMLHVADTWLAAFASLVSAASATLAASASLASCVLPVDVRLACPASGLLLGPPSCWVLVWVLLEVRCPRGSRRCQSGQLLWRRRSSAKSSVCILLYSTTSGELSPG